MGLQSNYLLQEAIKSFESKNFTKAKTLLLKILSIETQNFDALNLVGVIFGIDNNHVEALNFFKKAQKIRPDNNLINFNLAKALSETGNDIEAIKYYKIVLKSDKNHFGSSINLGKSLYQLKRYNESLSYYDQAIKLKPDFAEAYNNKGNTLEGLKRYDEALANYDQAIKLKPDFEYLFGKILNTKMFMCDWQNFEDNVQSLLSQIGEGKKSSLCLPILALTDSLYIQHKTAKIWGNDKNLFNSILGSISKSTHNKKIRIGYYSADFYNHALASLIAELFECHDKTKFELIAFSFGPETKDEMRQRLITAFDQFIDVRFKSEKDIALISRKMCIDIAVDLNGYTNYSRTKIFSYRVAPIQVNYLGYPGTMGLNYIDYIIADPIIIPIDSQQHYSEKVVYLPNSYQVNDRKRVIADKIFTKEELGLPKDSFVFCCFNNNFKLTPNIFDSWVRILNAVKGSVLWLLEDNPTARLNLRKEAAARGLSPDRLIFAKKINAPEHLARHRAADLFLDTMPYNAHTTASDALWAGLPLLTCMGMSFASRVSASLLHAIKLPELITSSQEQYEAKAIELATSHKKLKAIKDKLESNRLTTPLFDTPRFTKHIEAGFKEIYQLYQANLPPNNIYIKN
jgi:predicted O-linked N-acetylglucosamine transferase (SPINDLY family)